MSTKKKGRRKRPTAKSGFIHANTQLEQVGKPSRAQPMKQGKRRKKK